MSTLPKTLQQAILYFADPDNCLRLMVERRWPDGVICPTCGSAEVRFISTRRFWECKAKHPKRQFSAKVGTIFEDSALGLDKWLCAMWMLSNCKNGISSYEIARGLGITQKSAWFVLHRLRVALKNDSLMKMGDGGPVEMDETYVGGKPKNMHRQKRLKLKTAESGDHKTAVFGMLDRETRQVRAKVVPNVKRETLQAEILANVQHKATIYTDAYTSYDNLKRQEFVHEAVNHMEAYVRGQVHTQGIENFWSLLKRGLSGTYVAVEPFHLDRYIDEQVFRYNNRATKDNRLDHTDRFLLALSQIVNKRLIYADLTGKADARPF